MLSERATTDIAVVSDEDALRAQFYRLLARFLTAPPTQSDLNYASGLQGGDTPLGKAVHAFSRVAASTGLTAADDEYHALFIGVGRGELLPYGSYYLTGFLHEKPLARLRKDMARHGLEANPAATEPEDHAAALFDMMATLIDGRIAVDGGISRQLTLKEQKDFFDAHIASWMPLFFRDLEGATSSVFYAALAGIGSRFLEIESAAFEMD